MKHRLWIVGLALASVMAVGQTVKVSRASGNTENLNKVRPGSAVNAQDRTFFKQAIGTNLAEVKLGQLAQRKASGRWAGEYGKMMVMEHTNGFNELRVIAGKLRLPLSKAIPGEAQALYNRLSKLSGTAFDNAYRNAMLDGHNKYSMQIEREIKSGNNSLIRNHAITSGPVVRLHYKMAQRKVTKI